VKTNGLQDPRSILSLTGKTTLNKSSEKCNAEERRRSSSESGTYREISEKISPRSRSRLLRFLLSSLFSTDATGECLPPEGEGQSSPAAQDRSAIAPRAGQEEQRRRGGRRELVRLFASMALDFWSSRGGREGGLASSGADSAILGPPWTPSTTAGHALGGLQPTQIGLEAGLEWVWSGPGAGFCVLARCSPGGGQRIQTP
jgi:hypothetical protein